MNNPQQAESRAITTSAALLLVALGFAGFLLPQLGSVVSAQAPWTGETQLTLMRCFAATQHIASVVLACALIVAGVVLIGHDRDYV
jgi:hypothetical protein